MVENGVKCIHEIQIKLILYSHHIILSCFLEIKRVAWILPVEKYESEASERNRKWFSSCHNYSFDRSSWLAPHTKPDFTRPSPCNHTFFVLHSQKVEKYTHKVIQCNEAKTTNTSIIIFSPRIEKIYMSIR